MTAAGSESHVSTFACRNRSRRCCYLHGRRLDHSLLADTHRTLSTNPVAFSGGSGLKTKGRTAMVFGFGSDVLSS